MGWRDFQNSIHVDKDHNDHKVNILPPLCPLSDLCHQELKTKNDLLTLQSQTILTVKTIFPGSRVLSEAEAEQLLPKLKLAEWDEVDSYKKGGHE